MSGSESKRLSTAQAAERLNIKAATLYAYVSRGLISSERNHESGGSSFDPLEVEVLARKRRTASAPAALTGAPLMVLDSPFALLTEADLYYRGRLASELALHHSFEQVASWLWSADSASLNEQPIKFSRPEFDQQNAAAPSALGSDARGTDFMLQALLIASSYDPFKRDLSPPSVAKLGMHAIAYMIEALPNNPSNLAQIASTASVAEVLWFKLTDRLAQANEAALLNMVLVLLLDHDLAASTFAGRVAASARAHPYAALISALSTLDSSLHGSVSVAARELIVAVMAGQSPERAISAQLNNGYGIPGFGHRIYQRRDPRAATLLAALRELPPYREALNAAAAIIAVVRARTESPVNIDFALAVLIIGAEMPADGGQTIFAVARSAGWLAHIMDEYRQAPLRLRPIGQYTGSMPQNSVD